MKGIIAVGQEPSVAHAIVGENALNGVWPPDVTPLAAPLVPGVGEVWVDLQWFEKPDKPAEPGAVATGWPRGQGSLSTGSDRATRRLAEGHPGRSALLTAG